MISDSLTSREERFVREYLVDACGTQAAIRAGVAPSGAHVWASRALRKAKVAVALKKLQTADAARLGLEREDVLAGLMESIDQAKAQSNPMAMISGWREIAKLMGLFSPEVKHIQLNTAGEGVIRRLELLSDAELLEIIEAGQRVK